MNLSIKQAKRTVANSRLTTDEFFVVVKFFLMGGPSGEYGVMGGSHAKCQVPSYYERGHLWVVREWVVSK